MGWAMAVAAPRRKRMRKDAAPIAITSTPESVKPRIQLLGDDELRERERDEAEREDTDRGVASRYA